ncbi:hypothetical protein Ga0061065_12022 [Marinomonas fungiae]|uniref:Uncharacterized protein n=1 Tax=Marinomonas fungiae TaxID=1137284 RepID=A0A0K6IU54_9GAMM|nr:hypothetical protein Ga0061065_12022 [Marinomonas fungiae]
MSLTKENWTTLEGALSGLLGHAKLKLGDREITLQKRMISENKLGLLVYIDGAIQQGMGWPDSKHHDPIVKQIWRARSRSYYTAKEQKDLIKSYGKRQVKKLIPNLEDQFHWYEPMFLTFKSLQRQYSRIEGLTLLEADGVKIDSETRL